MRTAVEPIRLAEAYQPATRAAREPEPDDAEQHIAIPAVKPHATSIGCARTISLARAELAHTSPQAD